MNQETKNQETKKENWVVRLLCAVGEKLMSGMIPYEMGMCPYDTQVFMSYYGYTVDEFMSNPSRINHGRN